jgi:hypothetical protein
MGLIATGEKQKQPQEQQLLNNGIRQNESTSRGYTPGILKVLLPLQQSRGTSLL